jgi:phosphatidylethanolamine N-methyltransferase
LPQTEYHNKVITKIFKNPYYGCYALAVAIFSLGIFRDALYVYNFNARRGDPNTTIATPAPLSTNPPIPKS